VQAVIKLPLSAVMEIGGKSAVWVFDGKTMTVQPQPIEVAGAEGNTVVVASGLSDGQRVVTAGVHVLTPGQKATLYDDGAASAAQR
jgi:multidrug efflux pump subunit AcrA (membrane-fusion protein)